MRHMRCRSPLPSLRSARGVAAIVTISAVLTSTCSTAPGVRSAAKSERARIVTVVQDVWNFESGTRGDTGLRRQPGQSGLHPWVAGIRVSRVDPNYASAAVELRDVRDRHRAGTAIVVISALQTRQPQVADGPATTFPSSCTPRTRKAIRDLLCPDPWAVVGHARPSARLDRGHPTRVDAADLHTLDWADATLPGATCGSAEAIHLRDGRAFIKSAVWPWWSSVEVTADRPSSDRNEYGDVDGDGRVEAAVPVVCSNGGGTADGQLGFTYVVFTLSHGMLVPIGLIAPQQPSGSTERHVPLLVAVELLHRRVLAEEAWYGSRDNVCCPSGRAWTVWSYRGRLLRRSRTIVLAPPDS